MYTKRIQLTNYGPIEKLDIEFPFEGDRPKPVLLVGENGSGKSILLSHIVNGLVSSKGAVYPESPEVETGKVYKLRSSYYVKSGSKFYFGKVEFEEGLSVVELLTLMAKEDYEEAPFDSTERSIVDAWGRLGRGRESYFSGAVSHPDDKDRVKMLFSKRCVLYFPPNRFEEPAWLNEENLRSRADYMDQPHIEGQTGRRVVNSSPLSDNQKWLFEVVYDMEAHERRIVDRVDSRVGGSEPISQFLGYYGPSTKAYNLALKVVRTITERRDARFGIGRRHNRVVSLESELAGTIVPNVFQLSSGETSLLNLFLSILRDFDLSGTSFSKATEIRGIVVVDEIDLHLHAVHQHEILPVLIKMFPNVQFVVTTHSPLFVLGMQRAFGEDGFALYRLPEGHRISPEEFAEFGDAYRAFTETLRFSNDMRTAIEGAQKPIAFVEGGTDKKYIHRASQLLGKETVFQLIEMLDGGGKGNLDNVWKLRVLPDSIVHEKVVLLYDCDRDIPSEEYGNLVRQAIPRQHDHPIEKGIENLFSKETLERAFQYKPAFIDIDPQRTRTVRGQPEVVAEEWTINDDEKTNMCDWLCENGSQEDFQGFHVVFDLIEQFLGLSPATSTGSESETVP